MKKLIESSLSGKYKLESEKDILTIRIEKDSLLYVMGVLKSNKDLLFNQLTDICCRCFFYPTFFHFSDPAFGYFECTTKSLELLTG